MNIVWNLCGNVIVDKLVKKSGAYRYPKQDINAVKYDEISYLDILNKDLKVMDSTATSLCRDNKIPLVVFGIDNPDNIVRIIKGEKIGTKLILDKNRPEEDFAKEKAEGTVSLQTICGVEFLVIEL